MFSMVRDTHPRVLGIEKKYIIPYLHRRSGDGRIPVWFGLVFEGKSSCPTNL